MHEFQPPSQQNGIFAANRAVGRISLAVGASGGTTRRKRVEEAGSLRVRFPTPPGAGLDAALVNVAGGIAGGDRLDVTVEVGEGACLSVTSVAAEKVYRTLGPEARIAVQLTLGRDSTLNWLPQEVILFDRARLSRSIEIDMAERARLVLAEMVVFGRSAMGERLEEGSLFDRWRLRREGRLVFAETMLLDGPIADKLAKPAVAKGGAAVATLLFVPGDDALASALRDMEPSFRGEVAASAWNGLAVARFLGVDGAVVRHDLTLALSGLGVTLPRLWLN
jgi:urease accessory protein